MTIRSRLALPAAALLVIVAVGAFAFTYQPAHSVPVSSGPATSGPATSGPVSYLSAAKAGVARSSAWWDATRGWYRNRLGRKQLATNWGIVHLFDAKDALAIADPTRANVDAVRAFARGAELYWNPDLRPVPGYGPSVGNRGANHRTWYDDEGWWGIAFYDAFRATGDRRYLASADRALSFLDSGWDPASGGIWWDTRRTFKASESLAGATLLAAYLYDATHKPRYLSMAKRYIAWADKSLRGADGLYSSRPANGTAMPYIEGPMATAFVSICHSTGNQTYCAKGEDLADRTVKRFPVLTMGPQYDSIYVRALLELYRLDGKKRWYQVAAGATNRAMAKASTAGGLYKLTWDGRSITTIGTDPDKLQTHAATTSAIAWMAAARVPR